MRIKSSFSDYYDCMLAYGQADDLVYIRETKTVSEGNKPSYLLRSFLAGSERLVATTIHFCDRVFVCINFMGDYYYSYDKIRQATLACNIDIERRLTWHELDIKNSLIPYREPLPKPLRVPRIKSKGYKKHRAKQVEQPVQQLKHNFISINEQLGCPVAVKYYDGKIVINPCLNKFQFAKVKDPTAAFQEIYQWLSNKASPEKPIPKMDDKLAIEQHGFNKFSFRKESTKR